MRVLILSGMDALTEQIGTVGMVEKAIKQFISLRPEYQVEFVYYDRDNTFNVPKTTKTAQNIRSFIRAIEKTWGQIDFILLLGGDDVIPFYRLDNPCDDGDAFVLSDNPYASRDDHFMIPERACARIPDNKDASFIIGLLNKGHLKEEDSFGMSAKVWKKASEDVYQHVDKKNDLKISPPVESDSFKSAWLQKKDYLYFNLHGSMVSSSWYGQDGSTYPVALSPGNVTEAAGLVAAECCYGGYILGKTHENALVMKFLHEQNVVGFCGSTTIAYGPAMPPSTEADLLVKYFLQYTCQGLTIGESLKNAKLDFARKVLRRQGFLDEDDQKTLLQFVLYGDPTLRMRA
jgi:hypothetical protein